MLFLSRYRYCLGKKYAAVKHRLFSLAEVVFRSLYKHVSRERERDVVEPSLAEQAPSILLLALL